MIASSFKQQGVGVKVNGYRGIWYDLGQRSEYGPKYSGGFATYTAKHRPMALHAPKVAKTFFTYGGTPAADSTHLLIMASTFDHATNTVPQPTLVMDKEGVIDPHDNPAIQIDKEGYIYIFVSGRNISRPGHIFKSLKPYSTESFERLTPQEGMVFTYPQIWYLPGTEGCEDEVFFHMFTRYNGGTNRQLYFATSKDACQWSPARIIADMGGQYEVSNHSGELVGTAFNRHPDSNVDARTDLYYMQTTDRGMTWMTVDGKVLSVPLVEADNPARVIDFASEGRLVYVKDMAFDEDGFPVILYVTSSHHQPGPQGEPRLLQLTRWDGRKWITSALPPSATGTSSVIHNYNTGCLHLDGGEWTVIAPTSAAKVPDADASQLNIEHYWGQGAEMERWLSTDKGATWKKTGCVTQDSPRKHGYARSVQNAKDPFYTFWADGNPETLSEVHLYFGNRDGTQYWELPYSMDDETTSPLQQIGG